MTLHSCRTRARQRFRINSDDLYTAQSGGVPKRETITNELKEAFAEAPTLDELTEAIRRAKTNSSAGMNGVSYNMLKKLPSELIANIHYCLTRIWAEKGTLDWWSDRWLVAIPKKEQDVTKVGDLRPLILVDTIRKLWCKILLQRILEVWKRNDLLRHAQHGFCAGRSTMTASLMFINMLEEVIKKGEVLHTCSWGIR